MVSLEIHRELAADLLDLCECLRNSGAHLEQGLGLLLVGYHILVHRRLGGVRINSVEVAPPQLLCRCVDLVQGLVWLDHLVESGEGRIVRAANLATPR